MNKKSVISFIIIVFIGMMNCHPFTPDIFKPRIVDSEINYLPLTVGNTWNYWTSNRESIQLTTRISNTININTTTYYILEHDPLGDDSEYADTIRVDNTGRIFIRQRGNEYLWFDLTLPDGATYSFSYNTLSLFTGDSYIVTVRRNVTIDTDVGLLENCIDLFFDIPNAIDDEYGFIFAPGIGIVQRYGAWVNLFIHSYQLYE